MKDIKDYEGEYAITSCGKVWSYKSKKFLRQTSDKDGYLLITLSQNGKLKTYKVHRLVAEAYIKNIENLPQVNHKDENKTNNCINNLEWCNEKYNANYGTRNAKMSKKIYCKELDKIFNSQHEAARELDLDQGAISRACSGKYKSAGGYHWELVKED